MREERRGKGRQGTGVEGGEGTEDKGTVEVKSKQECMYMIHGGQ